MILRHYLSRQVLLTTALVVGFLVVMLLGGRLIRYFGMAADGGLQVSVLFRLIGYNLPYFLELVLPLSFFIALMLTFGRLYADSEMAVLNAAGISRGQLGWYLLPVMTGLLIAEASLSLVAKPWGLKSSETIWQDQKMLEVFDLIRPKEFISQGDYHVYVGQVGDNREYLADVVIIKTDPTNPAANDSVIIAERAIQVADNNHQQNSLQIQLINGKRYEINPHSLQYSQIAFGQYTMTLDILPKDNSELRISAWTTVDLIKAIADPRASAELAYRLSLPCLIILALLYALPLSKISPRSGRWGKLLPAVLLFVAMVLVLISLKKPIEKQKISVWIYPVVMFILLAIGVYSNYHSQLTTKRRLA